MELQEVEIKALIREAQAGSQGSFAKIYDLFFKKIYKFIFFRTKVREEAEDLTSLVFLKAWQGLPNYKFRDDVKFSTWLFQIARFTLIDYYRRQKAQPSLEAVEEIGLVNSIEKEAEIALLKRNLLKLPEKYQTVINLRYFEDLDYKQIAKIMGKTEIGVRVLLHRALKKLAKLIKIYEI
jgi:RNA polymerase sigma-70 factor (ECF subfamily)